MCSTRASFRVLQCVLPSGGAFRVRSKIRASSGVKTDGLAVMTWLQPLPCYRDYINRWRRRFLATRLAGFNQRIRGPVREQQDHARAPRVLRPDLATPHSRFEFATFVMRQHQRHIARQRTSTGSLCTGR